MARLKLAFLGTPEFALPALDALVRAGHEIACVYCQPPRPTGRGQKPKPSPVERAARRLGLIVRTPESLKSEAEQQAFAALALDAAVVVAYGLILPEAVLNAPKLGCLNAHASLLPRWRGAAPIARAILAGDRETGITVIRLVPELDAGPILVRRSSPIAPDATAASLHDALAALAAPLLLEALDGLARGTLEPRVQPLAGITYAAKIEKSEARIAWSAEAEAIERKVRAFNPHPGAYFEHRGERIKLLKAVVVDLLGNAPPGTVLDGQLTVACGGADRALRLIELKRAGRRAMTAQAFLRGFPIPEGSRL